MFCLGLGHDVDEGGEVWMGKQSLEIRRLGQLKVGKVKPGRDGAANQGISFPRLLWSGGMCGILVEKERIVFEACSKPQSGGDNMLEGTPIAVDKRVSQQ